MRYLLAVLFLSALTFVPRPPATRGCAAVPHRGERVGVNSEEAIIVYDAATRTEHFIRRADFRTEAKDFGFLVPTPKQPELGETDSSVFATLQSATAPRHVFSGNVKRIVVKRSNEKKDAAMAKSRPPNILERKKVAGYDAVVLQAHDTDGLKDWLKENQYDARPAVVEWLKWYVENQWIITAFKVARDEKAAWERWAKSVRMSFETDAPFYPYREPEDMRTGEAEGPGKHPRQLRVYFLANARYQGTLGADGAWAGKTVWSNVCPKERLTRMAGGFGMPAKESESLAAKTWHLTEFEDNSSPRPGTHDVFFRRAENQATVERPVVYYDQYEYVYEDDPKSGSDKSSGGSDKLLYIGLIVGGVAVAVLFATTVFLLLRRKQSNDRILSQLPAEREADERTTCPHCGFRYLTIVGSCPKCSPRR